MAFVGFEAGGLPGDPYSQHFYAPAAYGYYTAAPAAAPPMPAGALTGGCSFLEEHSEALVACRAQRRHRIVLEPPPRKCRGDNRRLAACLLTGFPSPCLPQTRCAQSSSLASQRMCGSAS